MPDSIPTPADLEDQGLDDGEIARYYQFEQARALHRIAELHSRMFSELRGVLYDPEFQEAESDE